MEYICQFFDDPKHFLRMYIVSKDLVFKNMAEKIYNCPFILLEKFTEKNGNVLIWNNINILYLKDYIYLSDDNNNYVRIRYSNLQIEIVYINDLKYFHHMWLKFCNIMIDIYLGDVKLKYDDVKTYYHTVDMTNLEFAVYKKDIIKFQLCTN